MAKVIREQQVGDYKVVIKQREDGEEARYQTVYAILTYDEYGDRAFLPDDFGYGNSMEYIESKFARVVDAVEGYVSGNSLEEMHRRVAKSATDWNLAGG